MSDVIMIVGPTATGKSTVAERFLKAGYKRVNRDAIGGKLENIIPVMKDHLIVGENVILDNTHLTPDKREPFITAAKKQKSTIKAFYMETPIDAAQVNFSNRAYNMGIMPWDLDAINSSDSPNIFPPVVMFRHFKEFVKPTLDEGFASVESVKFDRKWPNDFTNKAILVDFDSTLRITATGEHCPQKPEDIIIMPNRTKVLQHYVDQGYVICGVSNQSQVAKGTISYDEAKYCYDATINMIGVPIDYVFCPHRSAPISCWCRKPMPGIGVYFINKYKLNPAECIMVGDLTTDKTFATRSGFQYVDESEFFA